MSDIFKCEKHGFGSRINLYCPFCKVSELEEQMAELSKAHTFCVRHNEDDIDFCPNCTIEEMDERITELEEFRQLFGEVEVLRVDGDPAGRLMPDRILLKGCDGPVEYTVRNATIEGIADTVIEIRALKQGDSDE